jgi:hypothetical protein
MGVDAATSGALPIDVPRMPLGDAGEVAGQRSRLAGGQRWLAARDVADDDAHRPWRPLAQLKAVRGDELEWRLH